MGSASAFARQALLLAAAIGALAWAAWSLAGPVAAGWCAAGGAVGAAFFVGVSWLRHRELRRLAAEIDEVLHTGRSIDFSSCREGDVAVLRSEVSKMVDRLARATRQLDAEKASLADGMADISHQLRTPLTAINLMLSAVGRTDDPVERKALLRDLEEQVAAVSWLVTALLKLARADAGTLPLEARPVAVASLIGSASSSLALAMDLRGVVLEVSCQEGASFMGDERWAAEALGNVLKNCMECSPEGGIIRVSAVEDALACRITVTDNGPGIAEADLPRIFERFYSGDASAGFGIGLSLAQALVAAQGGTLRAGNAPEGGARFTIAFPKLVV